MPGTCKYQNAWEKDYPWVSFVRTHPQSAYCGICLKSFKINNSGVGQLKSHSKCHESGKRKETALNWKNQRTLVSGDRAELGLSKKNWLVLSTKKAILKTEILQALHMVEKTHSFASATGDSGRFKLMFPDSTIAKGYQQSDSKVQYVINYDIADHLKKQLIYDVKNTPYSVLFDKTTNSQVKKQYDGYVICWSKRSDNIVHSYCGSLFVGHCAAVDLVKHYEEFVKQLDIDSKFLLHFGMDRPNVNLSFEDKLTQKLPEVDTSFLKLGTCSLHPVHPAFQKGIKQLFQGQVPSATSNSENSGELPKKKGTLDLDDFFTDIHSFFKLSSARLEDYTSLESVTGVVAEYAKKHAETRWVSMTYVAVRCLEQWPNLKEF